MSDYKDYISDDIDETFFTKYANEYNYDEYVFILSIQNKKEEQIGILEDFIDDIMEQIPPEKDGWTAFALEYQVYARYMFATEPWLIPNLKDTYEQFKGVASSSFRFKETKEVLARLLDMMERALKENGKLYIYYY